MRTPDRDDGWRLPLATSRTGTGSEMQEPNSPPETPLDPGQVAELVAQVAAALRMARWSGVEAVARLQPLPATPPAGPSSPALSPRPTAMANPRLDAPPMLSRAAPAAAAAVLQRPASLGPAQNASAPVRPASLGGAPRPTPPRPASLATTRVTGPVAVAPAAARTTAPVPPPQPASLGSDPGDKAGRLDAIWPKVDACARCGRGSLRQRTVHGEGASSAKLMLLLDYPSETDEATGRPAQGSAGQLLERMLGAMGLTRADVWMTSLVLCRDPADHKPSAEEARTCSAWLKSQWDVVQPQLLLAFGEVPAQLLAQRTAPLSDLRGRWMTARQVPAMATWSLQDVLADQSKKREVWADLQLVMERLALSR